MKDKYILKGYEDEFEFNLTESQTAHLLKRELIYVMEDGYFYISPGYEYIDVELALKGYGV